MQQLNFTDAALSFWPGTNYYNKYKNTFTNEVSGKINLQQHRLKRYLPYKKTKKNPQWYGAETNHHMQF